LGVSTFSRPEHLPPPTPGASGHLRSLRLEVDDVLEAGEKTVVLARLVARRHDGSLETHPVIQLWRFQDGR
jgi:hypothetical protein